MSISGLSLVSVVVVVGGCGLVVAVAVLVIWAILDNSRRSGKRDKEQ